MDPGRASQRSSNSEDSLFTSRRWILLVWSVAFALAYGQSPLFTSNQNQYFLQGLAKAGYGQLNQDWLANTLDPTPVFSWLVWLVAETLPLATFYLFYGLLLAGYFLGLWFILDTVLDLRSSRLRFHGSALLLIILHSAALRFGLSRGLGAEATYLIEGGLAGQRLLGSVLQPSSFGVLLLISIALFLHKRPYLAAALAALAAVFHPTYLLSAAALTISYLWLSWRHSDGIRQPLKLGTLALLIALPIVVYTYQLFQPSSASAWSQAAQVLVTDRIPHHALPAEWFSWTSIFKLAVVLIGLDLALRTRLGQLMLFPVGLALVLTLAQLITGSQRLALLFPWRLSTWIVPINAGLIAVFLLLKVIGRLEHRWPEPRPLDLGLIVVAAIALAGAGLFRTLELVRQQRFEAAQPLYDEVRQQLEPGHTYLIPPKLQDFRLETGAPVFVDFKAIPYKDRELLAWQERLQLAQFFYRDDPALISCGLLPRINAIEGITHVVLEQDQFGLECPELMQLYRDGSYALFRYQD